ncbi:hypothetical protein PITCH_A1580014 [uncultured Desulfobacterium sp.]|uniref:Uncharacterized protein n=1 Tax=uncultured Desulfobacterium sp. TaxID=201089 RepID=A0A445MTY4_9BACT|nr:hypothetical protein PITCH_A1580014 [uncultured Desulfobacterium sp.]
MDAIMVLLKISPIGFRLVSSDYFYLFLIGTHFAISYDQRLNNSINICFIENPVKNKAKL